MLFRHAADYGIVLEAIERIVGSKIYQSNRNLYDELAQAVGWSKFSMEVETMDELRERIKTMDQKSVEKGIQQGIDKGIEIVAGRMIVEGFSASEIQTCTGLTLEQIENLDSTC